MWKNAKILLGCAVFAEILKPVGILSKVLQKEEICLYESIEGVIKTKSNPIKAVIYCEKVLNRVREEEIEDPHAIHTKSLELPMFLLAWNTWKTIYIMD